MFVGSTAKPMTRPEVNAGPIERILSPLNVGVDIGSRGVGDASGVGEGVGVAATDGDGDAGGRGGSCARNSIEIRDNAHEDMYIDNFLLVVDRDGACRALRITSFRVQALACPAENTA